MELLSLSAIKCSISKSAVPSLFLVMTTSLRRLRVSSSSLLFHSIDLVGVAYYVHYIEELHRCHGFIIEDLQDRQVASTYELLAVIMRIIDCMIIVVLTCV